MKILISILLIVFSLQLNGQVLNGGFEDVEYIETWNDSVLYPQNWYSKSPQLDGEITTDSYSGVYAMYLTSWYSGNNTVYFYNGSQEIRHWGVTARNGFLKGAGTPIQELPTSLEGYYKFENAKPNDSIVVSAYLKKYLTDLDSIVIVGYGKGKFPPNDEYQKLEVQIEKLSNETPDSIIVQIETSTNVNFCENFTQCNFLTIDDLRLDFTTTTIDKNEALSITVLPNPVSELVNVNSEVIILEISIFNDMGMKLKTINVNKKSEDINMTNFPEGIYLFHIHTSNSKITTKKVLKHN